MLWRKVIPVAVRFKEWHMLAALFRHTTLVVYHVAHPLLALAILALLGIMFLITAAGVALVILHYGRK